MQVIRNNTWYLTTIQSDCNPTLKSHCNLVRIVSELALVATNLTFGEMAFNGISNTSCITPGYR